MAERDKRGKFVKGHKGLGGRPRRDVEIKYLSRMLQVVTPEEWDKAVKAMLDLAKNGNVTAFKVIAEYAIGKPTLYIQSESSSVHMSLDEWKEQAESRKKEIENL
jgi:hypothetical protein